MTRHDEPPTPAPSPSAGAPWLAVVAGVVTLGVYLLLRRDVVLADDWMLLPLFADRADCRGLDWGLLVADHWTPWLYNDWGYYRPTTSLVMAAWMEVLGAPPGRWNLLNPILHAANVTAFVLLLERMRLPRRSLVMAGAFVILHPAMVEPLTWFSSLNELVAFGGTLLACFGVCRLRAGRPRTWLPWCFGLWIAFTGKENGIVAPLVLVAIDRLLGPRSWRAMLRDHLLRTGPVLALAIAARAVAGCLDPTGGGEGFDRSLGHFFDSLLTKLGLTLLPTGTLPPFWGAGVGIAVVAAAMLACRRTAASLAAAAALSCAYAVLGTHHHVDSSYGGGRMLYPVVFTGGLLFALLLAIPKRRLAVAAALAAMAGLSITSGAAWWRRSGQFVTATAAVDRTITAVRTAYRELPGDGLLSPFLMPITPQSTLAFLPTLWFGLVEGEVPGANRVLALTSLSSLIHQSQSELLRALPARAAFELGATLLNVTDDGVPALLRAADARGRVDVPASPLRADEQGMVRLPAPVSPLRIETVALHAPGAVSASLRWLFAGGGLAPAASQHPLHDGAARIQTGDDFLLLTSLGSGGIAGLQVEARLADGSRRLEGIAVRLHGEPDWLPAIAPALPPVLRRDRFEQDLRAPAIELSPGARLRFGLLLPSSGTSFEVRPGEAIVLPARFARYLDWTLVVAPSLTVAWWFYEQFDDATPPRLGRRSPVQRRILQR